MKISMFIATTTKKNLRVCTGCMFFYIKICEILTVEGWINLQGHAPPENFEKFKLNLKVKIAGKYRCSKQQLRKNYEFGGGGVG